MRIPGRRRGVNNRALALQINDRRGVKDSGTFEEPVHSNNVLGTNRLGQDLAEMRWKTNDGVVRQEQSINVSIRIHEILGNAALHDRRLKGRKRTSRLLRSSV